MKNVCLIQFAKRPIAGFVKTRLIADLGAEGALDVHCRLLKSTYDVLCASHTGHAQLWWDEAWDSESFCHQLNISPEEKVQQGRELGERMQQALLHTLRDYRKVLLVGSDCPELSADYLAKALEVLNGEDVVLGPADDGGFVLIGAKRFVSGAMSGIDWGTATVLQDTKKSLLDSGLSVGVLSTLYDVDDLADYSRWLQDF